MERRATDSKSKSQQRRAIDYLVNVIRTLIIMCLILVISTICMMISYTRKSKQYDDLKVEYNKLLDGYTNITNVDISEIATEIANEITAHN